MIYDHINGAEVLTLQLFPAHIAVQKERVYGKREKYREREKYRKRERDTEKERDRERERAEKHRSR